MIIVRLTSGLGNQMFQYSFYRFLENRYRDTVVKADVSWFYGNNDHHGYELDRIFSKQENSGFYIEKASALDILKVTGQLPNIIENRGALSCKLAGGFEKFRRYPNRVLREYTQKKREPYIIDQHDGTINNFDVKAKDSNGIYNEMYEKVTNLDTSKDWYIKGYWIEEKYIYGRIEEIREHFIFPPFEDEENIKLAKEIQATDSVSIHVRRGDYLSPIYENKFVSLGREYYEKAVTYARLYADDPVFYIFSDDPEFVSTAFDWLPEKRIVSCNSGDNSFRDMQLMSLCKHNIIANSTFSQWGALLNRNEGHITIYPKAYLNGQDSEIKKTKNWIRLPK